MNNGICKSWFSRKKRETTYPLVAFSTRYVGWSSPRRKSQSYWRFSRRRALRRFTAILKLNSYLEEINNDYHQINVEPWWESKSLSHSINTRNREIHFQSQYFISSISVIIIIWRRIIRNFNLSLNLIICLSTITFPFNFTNYCERIDFTSKFLNFLVSKFFKWNSQCVSFFFITLKKKKKNCSHLKFVISIRCHRK